MIKHSLTYSDRSTNEITQIMPSVDPQGKAILILPGMGIRYSYYVKFATSLAGQGYEVFLTDYRGVGASNIRASKEIDFNFDQFVSDGLETIEHIVNLTNSDSLVILGHSLGGQLGCLLAARSEHVDGLILIASCLIYYKGFGFPERYTFRLAAHIFPLITRVMGYFPGHVLGFGGKVSKGIIKDWARNILTGEYESSSGVPYDKLIKTINTPTYVLSFENDRYSTEQAVANLCDKFENPNCITTERILKDKEGVIHDHYSWARQPKGVIPFVKSWLVNRLETSKHINRNYS